MTMRRIATTFLVGAAVALLASCGGGRGSADPGPSTAGATPAVATSPATASPTPAAPTRPTERLVARTTTALPVFAGPGDTQPTQVLPATTEFGSARALLVDERRDGWYRVGLPTRPNGSTGWVRAADVSLRTVDEHVSIDLATRTLTLSVGGRVVLTAPVAIGAPDAPTPTGELFVVDKLATPTDDSLYGPFALGLSGHSDVLTEFAGGDGQIGIHGTNDPSSIGRATSHGCVRVPNDVVTALNDLVPLGTPVTIT